MSVSNYEVLQLEHLNKELSTLDSETQHLFHFFFAQLLLIQPNLTPTHELTRSIKLVRDYKRTLYVLNLNLKGTIKNV